MSTTSSVSTLTMAVAQLLEIITVISDGANKQQKISKEVSSIQNIGGHNSRPDNYRCSLLPFPPLPTLQLGKGR